MVAAMGTLAVLSVLNFIGSVGQDMAFVRDVTYWLSISGRAEEFINGLICSEMCIRDSFPVVTRSTRIIFLWDTLPKRVWCVKPIMTVTI